jgi:putative SOS response-associated peptidase YedK
MCGRFSQFSSVNDLVSTFSVDESLVDDEVRPRWNVAPTQQVLVVAASSDGATRRLGTMRWGLVPSWAKDPSIGNRMINARADKVASSGAFRSAFRRRRCIVPADGFYEWHKQVDEHGKKAPSIPFHIHAADRAPLALAGLWEVWRDAEGTPMRSFTIITIDPNTPMAKIHDRMPVILDPADWDRWLSPEPLDDEEQAAMLCPAPDELLLLDHVSTKVNNTRNEGPDQLADVPAS